MCMAYINHHNKGAIDEIKEQGLLDFSQNAYE